MEAQEPGVGEGHCASATGEATSAVLLEKQHNLVLPSQAAACT